MEPIGKAAELFDLTGETALVTGASSGLGERFARVLAAHGAKTVLAARRADRLDRTAADIKRSGGQAIAVPLDVARTEELAAVFDKIEKHYGVCSILVNNAGMAATGKALEISEADWRRVMDVNLNSVWFLAQEAGRRLAAAGRPGTIINVASMLGMRILPGVAHYNVAKAGVIHMTRALAIELAPNGIRVNAMAPGWVESEMTEAYLGSPRSEATRKAIPLGRVGKAADLDGVLLLLASAKASGFMTGAVIAVDGGHMWSFV
ncbi:MAG: SDR family oxidoreductase [Pseudomonadota bacterium]|nr:SDR family oxidoreductase [Pseudomonadota bacterium]